MKKSVISVIIAAIVYLALYPLASATGMIHPACYAYAGTVVPLLFAFVYLLTAANMRCFGAAIVLNGFVLILGLIAGEGNLPFIIGMIGLAVLAEIIRGICGYDTLKGVRLSFVPFAFSFYTYSAHWWTDTAGSLAAAVAEMPAGYADTMAPVISNIPMLVVALILVIPIAILGMRLAEKVLKKQAAKLK
ncbi:MAG: MptD family putative ECF transporter S component [bacterium]|nr:MptD family putative ECF transporter S component [bacterium]